MEDSYEYGEEPDWREEIEIPADLSPTQRNIAETLMKTELRPTRFEVWAPFSCSSDKRFLYGIIYEGEGRYWYIEGKDSKFNSPGLALAQIMEDLEISRQVMINDEFNNIAGGV